MKRELKRLGSDEFIEVYDFTEFKKLKFNKFEIELGNFFARERKFLILQPQILMLAHLQLVLKVC
jgi:hypothetical protein